jgi:excisionase family DNA binding protein
MKRLLRIDEASEVLNISPRTLYRMLGEGALPGIKIRGGIRIDMNDIEDYIRKQKERFSIEYGFNLPNHDSRILCKDPPMVEDIYP